MSTHAKPGPGAQFLIKSCQNNNQQPKQLEVEVYGKIYVQIVQQ